jgi:hypothetical protein
VSATATPPLPDTGLPGATAAPASSRRRRVAAWVAIAFVLLVVGGIGGAVSAANQWAQRGALDPDSSGPDGMRAVIEVLRDHGVDVVVARDRAAAAETLEEGPATLVLPDAPALSSDAVAGLAGTADDVVLIEPRARTLDLLLPGSAPAGVAPGGADAESLEPDCEVQDAVRAGPVSPGGLYSAGDGTAACYPAADGFGLLVRTTDGGRVAAVDAAALFTNEHLAENGNAALAANLMGRHPLVVWYIPGLGDTDLADANPSLGELTPPWVSPVIVLLLVAGATAALWRGRRFGPLVRERLPVSVRAAETTEGRARLYARSRDALHAADQLRIPALGRIGRALGLGASASAGEIAEAAAATTGLERGAARGILIDDIPRGDADLVVLDARLRHLEGAVLAAARPERNTR